jgi:hypothetical protein
LPQARLRRGTRRVIVSADRFNVKPPMLRRCAIFFFGVIPATYLALFLTAFVYVGVATATPLQDWFLSLSPIYELGGLCGTIALWIVAFRSGALIRGRREGIVIGIMLSLGIAVAVIPMMIPFWWCRCAALSAIITALMIFPSIWRAVKAPPL